MNKCKDKRIDPIVFRGKGCSSSAVHFLADAADVVDRMEAGRRYCEFSITMALGDDLIELELAYLLPLFGGVGDPGVLIIFIIK